jgi:hypothetical protein
MRFITLHDMQFVGPGGKGIETLPAGTVVVAMVEAEISALPFDDRLAWRGGKVPFWGHDLRMPGDNSARGVTAPQVREDRKAAAEGRPANQLVPFFWRDRFRYAEVGPDLRRA